MDFLTDAGWVGVLVGIIGAVVGIVAIVVSIYLARPKKSLAFEIISDYPLISIRDEIKGRLKIFLDDEPVKNIQLLTVAIVNDGKVPVVATDYERPISIVFDINSKIISADIVEAKPESLTPISRVDNNKLSIDPFLMNGSDYIVVKLTVLEYTNSFKFDARVAGVTDIQQRNRSNVPLIARDILLEALRASAFGVLVDLIPSRRR